MHAAYAGMAIERFAPANRREVDPSAEEKLDLFERLKPALSRGFEREHGVGRYLEQIGELALAQPPSLAQKFQLRTDVFAFG